MGIGKLCRCNDFFVCGIQLSIADIVCNGAGKQMGILKNHTQRPAQIRLFDLVDVDAVVTDFSILNIVKPVDQVGDRRLPRAGGAHESHLFSRIGIHLDIVQHDFIIRIPKIHAVQHHVSLQLLVGNGSFCLMGMLPCPDPGPLFCFFQSAVRLLGHVNQCHITIVHFFRLIQQIKDPLRSCQCHNDGIKLLRYLRNRHVKTSGELQKRCQSAQCEPADAVNGKDGSHPQRQHIIDIPQIGHNRHENVGKRIGISGAFEQLVV